MAEQSKALGAGHEVTLIRTFKAPPALVFDCFTDADHLARWWGPLACENVVHKLEVRPGGGDPVDPYTALVYHGLQP